MEISCFRGFILKIPQTKTVKVARFAPSPPKEKNGIKNHECFLPYVSKKKQSISGILMRANLLYIASSYREHVNPSHFLLKMPDKLLIE